jgi:hypothetical protein
MPAGINGARQPLLLLQLLLTAAMGFAHQSCADPRDVETEVNYFAAALKSDPYMSQEDLIEKLRWSGIQDARVYDPVRDRMMERYRSVFEEDRSEGIATLSRILAISGMERYRMDLIKIGGASSMDAISILDLHVHRNTILQEGVREAPTGRLNQRRTQNMLLSSDLEMIRIAARRVYQEYPTDAELLGAVNKSLLRIYNLGMKSKIYNDAVLWEVKSLALSGNMQYRLILQGIAEQADSKKIARYARKHLKKM